MLKVSLIFGTRPEAIKLAPVVLAMKRDDRFACRHNLYGDGRAAGTILSACHAFLRP